MQMEVSKKNIKREVQSNDTDTVKKMMCTDEYVNTKRISKATDDSETSASIKTNYDIPAIEI